MYDSIKVAYISCCCCCCWWWWFWWCIKRVSTVVCTVRTFRSNANRSQMQNATPDGHLSCCCTDSAFLASQIQPTRYTTVPCLPPHPPSFPSFHWYSVAATATWRKTNYSHTAAVHRALQFENASIIRPLESAAAAVTSRHVTDKHPPTHARIFHRRDIKSKRATLLWRLVLLLRSESA